MALGYDVPLVSGAVLYLFAENVVTVCRFGLITDGARSCDPGGLAFRLVVFMLVGIGFLEFARTALSL